MVKPAIQYSWSRFIKDYWMFLDRRKSKFVFYSGIVSLSFVIPFITAFLLGKIVDFFVDYPQGGNLNLFYIYALSIAFLGAFQVWVRFFGKRGLTTLGADIRKDVRIEAMSKLMDLELKWHDKEDTGSKIQKINKGADDIHNGISYFTDAGIPIFIGIFGGIIAFLAFDLKYLAFALVYISIYLLIEKHFNYKINYWQDRLNKYKERVSGKLHESASNLLTIKSLGLKDSFKDSTSNYEKRAYKIWQKLRDTNHMKFKIAKSFGALGYGLFIVLVGLNVSKGIITIGSIVVFLSYFNKIKSGLDNITNRSSKIINIKSSIGRFMTIFGIEITIFGKKSQPTKSMFIAPGFWVDLRILICTCTVYALILTGAFKDEVKHVDTTLLKENLCDLVGDSQMRFINPFALFNELSISILLQILCPHDDDGDDDVDDRLVSIPSEWKER